MSEHDPDKLVTEVKYILRVPFEYSHKGNQEMASFITLVAPTTRNTDTTSVLYQAFFRAIPDGDDSSGDAKGDGSTPSGEDIMMMLAYSPKVDLPKVMATAIKLFTSHGVALIDGEVKLNKILMESVSHEDLLGMTGDYMASFILASQLSRMNAPSSVA